MFSIKDILNFINKIAPFNLAYQWDNCGLQVGSEKAKVKNISFALDATIETVNKTLENNSSLLITHHPLIFKSLKSINIDSETGKIINLALNNNLNIISAHTNFDLSANGVSVSLAKILNLNKLKPLIPAIRDLYKLCVFVPQEYEEILKQELFKAFFGSIGYNYINCSFSVLGTGNFKPINKAKPFLGTINKDEEIKEKRLELILEKKDIVKAKNIIYKVHPYQEPSFEFYPIKVLDEYSGLGLIGETENEEHFLNFCQEKLNLPVLKIAGPKQEKIKTVAIVPGSGGDYIETAKSAGADILITGDVSYHQALTAKAVNLMVLDAGHFETECLALQHLISIFKDNFNNFEFSYVPQKSPWLYSTKI